MATQPVRAMLAILLAVLALPSYAEDNPDIRKKLEQAMNKVYPALVQIHVVTVQFNSGREQKFESAGSGAIISEDGHVITNHHVAGKAKLIRCRLQTLEEVDATLVGTDPLADIAILKLDLSKRPAGTKLTIAEFGDSDALRVGDRVMAMGCPVALSHSVTMGIVSNMQMTIPRFFWPFTFKLDGEEVGTLVKWIGHDAQIFPGNSGGPLVNLNGQIVGINDIGIGLGGAIPGNLAKEVAQQLIKNGRVIRSWTGIRCQPLLHGLNLESGALVASVMENSPAEAAGIQPGDVILEYDGKPITVRFAEQIPDFNRVMLSTPVGKNVAVKVLRGEQKIDIALTTTIAEAARGEEQELRAWGVTARQLTTVSAQEQKRKTKAGAFVWSVRPGGPAGEAKPAINGEDVIVAVNDQPVNGLRHLVEMTEQIVKTSDKPVPVLVAFERRGERLLTVVKLGITRTEDKAGEISKAWLPAAYQVLTTDLAEYLKLPGASGVRLTQVYPKSSAEDAGLKTGDVITHVDGDVIASSQPEEIEVLAQMLRQYKIGAEVELTVRRAPDYAAATKIKLKLVGKPKSDSQMSNYKDTIFDFEARNVTYMDCIREQWDLTQSGVMVTAVDPGGWAAIAHLGVNDLILAVNRTPVTDAAALQQQIKEIAEKKPRHVSFFVRRGVQTLFVEMEPLWNSK